MTILFLTYVAFFAIANYTLEIELYTYTPPDESDIVSLPNSGGSSDSSFDPENIGTKFPDITLFGAYILQSWGTSVGRTE